MRHEDLHLPRFVTVSRFSELTGYSEDAIRKRKQKGVWAEGREWKYSPTGDVLMDMEGYNRWAARAGKKSNRGGRRATEGSTLATEAS